MGGSLRDQMLKAGLASKKQAKAAETEARKKAAALRKETPRTDRQTETEKAREAAHVAQAEKAKQDRERADREKAEQEAHACRAQVRDLADKHAREVRKPTGVYYFQHEGQTLEFPVDDALRKDLAQGKAGILRIEGACRAVARDIAAKAAERLPEALVLLHDPAGGKPTLPNDPYAEFPVPDDLVW